jgi:hypothetical protein
VVWILKVEHRIQRSGFTISFSSANPTFEIRFLWSGAALLKGAARNAILSEKKWFSF